MPNNDFPIAYMRLRTLLDAVVVNTMRYCMDGENADDCVARINGVEDELINMIGRVGGEAPCDEGYFNCGGVCVPYACVEGISAQAAAAE